MMAFQVIIRVTVCTGIVIAAQCQLAGLAIVRATSGAAARLRAKGVLIIPSLEGVAALYTLPIHNPSIAYCYTFVKGFGGNYGAIFGGLVDRTLPSLAYLLTMGTSLSCTDSFKNLPDIQPVLPSGAITFIQ